MKPLVASAGLLAAALAGLLVSATTMADEVIALPGLWKTTYEIKGALPDPRAPKVVWHCVDDDTDPWRSFAQLQDLPGMSCSRISLQRTSTSLEWRTECHGPGPAESADTVATEGAVVFDSPQHYRGWVKFSGTLMGYPIQSATDMDGSRRAACTSPSD